MNKKTTRKIVNEMMRYYLTCINALCNNGYVTEAEYNRIKNRIFNRVIELNKKQ